MAGNLPGVDELDSVFNAVNRYDGQDWTKKFSENRPKISRDICTIYLAHVTYSLINESSVLTSLTIVGAMYFVSASDSPPTTMVPFVLSNKPFTRAK